MGDKRKSSLKTAFILLPLLALFPIFVSPISHHAVFGISNEIVQEAIPSNEYGLEMSCISQEQYIEPGSSGEFIVDLQNTGLHRDKLTISLSSPTSPGWTANFCIGDNCYFREASVELDPGEAITISVHITAAPDAKPGDEGVLSLRAKSTGDPSKQASVRLIAAIQTEDNISFRVSCDTRTLDIHPGTSTKFLLELFNDGDIDDSYSIILIPSLPSYWTTNLSIAGVLIGKERVVRLPSTKLLSFEVVLTSSINARTAEKGTITVEITSLEESERKQTLTLEATTIPYYTDVPDDIWAYSAIVSLTSQALLSGYPDGSFKPDADISRAEFAKIISSTFELPEQKGDVTLFSDVDQNHWAYAFIYSAKAHGFLSGYPDGSFKPSNPITKAEILTVLMRILPNAQSSSISPHFQDCQESDWFFTSVGKAWESGVLKIPDPHIVAVRNDAYFLEPNIPASRAQTAVLLERALRINKERMGN